MFSFIFIIKEWLFSLFEFFRYHIHNYFFVTYSSFKVGINYCNSHLIFIISPFGLANILMIFSHVNKGCLEWMEFVIEVIVIDLQFLRVLVWEWFVWSKFN